MWSAQFSPDVRASADAHREREWQTIKDGFTADGPPALELMRSLESFCEMKSDNFLTTEDRVALIQSLLTHVTSDATPWPIRPRVASVLCKLLRKRKIPTGSLVVAWKPLYEVLHRLYFHKARHFHCDKFAGR